MKIQMEDRYGGSVTIVSKAVDIYDLVEDMVHCLLALGYHPNSIKDGILAKAEEYELEDTEKEIENI